MGYSGLFSPLSTTNILFFYAIIEESTHITILACGRLLHGKEKIGYNPRETIRSNGFLYTLSWWHELKIAVDIDGVLADQVGAVLRVIEKEYGQRYSQSDVNRTHWTFSGRELRSEIARLLADPEYTLSVPLIEGSQKGIRQLVTDHHDVCVVTARRPNAEDATKQWLSIYFPCLTEYYRTKAGTKHNVSSDVLIDDLDMNIVEFVKSDSNRRGILFVHPWSLNGTDIENYTEQVQYCPEWKSVVRAIHDIDGTKASDRGI